MPLARTSVVLLGIAASLSGPIRAADLELDVTYGNGGISALGADERLQGGGFVYTTFPPAVVLLEDGSALFAGTAANGSMRLLKVSPQGRLDARFGVDGRVDLPLGAASDGSSPGIAMLANGQIVVGGAAPAGTGIGGAALPIRARVVRLLADGSLDTRFGEGGFADRAIPGAEGPSRAVRVALDSQRRIRVVASCDPVGRDAPRRCESRSWRLQADGQFDAGFAESSIPNRGSGLTYPLAIASMADDSSFVLLKEPEDTMDNFERLLRILPDGRIDGGFANTSISAQIQAILAADRGLYVAQLGGVAGSRGVGEIVRLDALGATDPSFGLRGSVALTGSPLSGNSAAYMVALAADGPAAILASGTALSNTGPNSSTLVTRLIDQGPGAIDRSFGRDGFSQINLDLAFFNGQAVRRNGPGRILIAGLSLGGVATGTPVVVRLYDPGASPGSSPGVFGLSANVVSLRESAGPVTIQVLRSAGTRGPASLDYETVSGSAIEGIDFRASRGRLDWADGDGSARTVEIALLDDSTTEAFESFSLVFSNAVGARFFGDATVRVSVQDGAPPPSVTTPAIVAAPGAGSSGGGGALGDTLLGIIGGWLVVRSQRLPRRTLNEGDARRASRG